MDEEQEDALLNEATHAAADAFKKAGVELTAADRQRINDFLTALLSEKTEWIIPTEGNP